MTTTEAGPETHALGALSPRALAPQFLTGGVAPFLVYALCRHLGVPDSSALALSSIPPALSVLGAGPGADASTRSGSSPS